MLMIDRIRTAIRSGLFTACLPIFALAILSLGCEEEAEPTTAESAPAEPTPAEETTEEAEPAEEPQVAVAVAQMEPTEGNSARGTVRFTAEDDKVQVSVDMTGLEPNSTHAIHVHENGDCSASDASSAGGHWNPGGHPHALPPSTPRHAGDMGNVEANEEGNITTEFVIDTFTVGGEQSVLGHAVIVHENEDTGEGEAGEAGSRISCGVVQPGQAVEEG